MNIVIIIFHHSCKQNPVEESKNVGQTSCSTFLPCAHKLEAHEQTRLNSHGKNVTHLKGLGLFWQRLNAQTLSSDAVTHGVSAGHLHNLRNVSECQSLGWGSVKEESKMPHFHALCLR